MKAFLIDPEQQTVSETDVSSLEDIVSLIGFETIEFDPIADDADTLFFDEECFLRGASGRFQIDKLIPVSGKGIVVGKQGDNELVDVVMSADELKNRIQFL